MWILRVLRGPGRADAPAKSRGFGRQSEADDVSGERVIEHGLNGAEPGARRRAEEVRVETAELVDGREHIAGEEVGDAELGARECTDEHVDARA